MLTTLVALDLETTGLNAERDAIIEVAAVRFSDSEVLAEYQTLVRPEVEIPFRVRQLTGLTDDQLTEAPPIERVLPVLVEFIGGDPVVGHSADHDLSFLQRYGELDGHALIDTFELSSILVPEAKRYGLAPLAALLDLDAPAEHHRALADAHTHRLLYRALFRRARLLGERRLAVINRLARDVDWALAPVFAAAAERPLEELTEPDVLPTAPRPTGHGSRLVPADEPVDIATDALEQLIAPGGRLEHDLPGFEDRPGQRKMLRAVCEAFNYGDQVLIEAGTGIGKSLAYLLPSAAWSTANGRPVVVATNTINLQDQLLHKDLPVVETLLDIEVRGAVLKGRANYLCRTRLDTAIAQSGRTVDWVRALTKIVVWETVTATGDRAELLLQRAEADAWRRVSADAQTCSAEGCRYARAGECWLHRARSIAEGAHVVVVNHALLVSDMLVDNRVLPAYERLIVDEAHHLENVATTALGVSVGSSRIADAMTTLEGRGSGLLPRVSAAIAASDLPNEARGRFGDTVGALQKGVLQVKPVSARLFEELDSFLSEHSDGRAQQVRLTDSTRAQPAWMSVERAWDELLVVIGELRSGLNRLAQSLSGVDEFVEGADTMSGEIGGVQRELADIDSALTRTISRPSGGDVLWAGRGEGGRVTLHAAPLHVGDTLSRSLYPDKETVVLTSATLRTAEGFGYIRDRLALNDASEEAVASPFDYTRQALLFIPTDMPTPNQPDYHAALDQVLTSLSRTVEGRTLVLYTSYSALKRSYKSIVDPLGRAGIVVLGQGIDGGRQKLLDQFRDAECPTVLLGTRSFWEGIDVPGPSLSCLVIARLPFDVPTDPVVEARADTFDDPFREYSIPQAILRFRQGFGRLIRSADDRGIVAVLDSRVNTKFYGHLFLDALPPIARRDGPLHTLPTVAERFMVGDWPGPGGAEGLDASVGRFDRPT